MKKFFKLLTSFVFIFIISVGVYSFLVFNNYLGELEGPGVIEGKGLSDEIIFQRIKNIEKIKKSLEIEESKQILFGDLHVHTTYSTDAFMFSLPYLNGTGASPIADACDYARYCSALDFWSINDHAEALTPRKWADTKESIRQCNNMSSNNDLVSFLGFEWTQVGGGDDHFGHKNVIFLDTDDSRVPPRAIAADGIALQFMREGVGVSSTLIPSLVMFKERERILNFDQFVSEISQTPLCNESNSFNDPLCQDTAADPNVLFSKLKNYKSDFMVIPHGTSWGFYTPPLSDWKKQLEEYTDDSQFLIEIFSGHGNSEEYRSWNDIVLDSNGDPACPEATKDFLPTCRQVEKLMQTRCDASELSSEECTKLVAQTVENSVNMAATAFSAIREAEPGEYLNAGQCNDCFLPTFNHRPLGSAQYILAISDFSDPSKPKRFKFGFIGSSDNHGARPGTGYKEIDTIENTESAVFTNSIVEKLNDRSIPKGKLEPYYREVNAPIEGNGFNILDTERNQAYFMTGGLVATHSNSKSREDIWNSLENKEVYATSGTRILLWFDAYINAEKNPMGSEIYTNDSPRFVVKASGSFKQLPGCPEYSLNSLSPSRLDQICNSECYNPSNIRKKISRIEVIKILPQKYENEPIEGLIKDVWKTFECNSEICSIEFFDEDYKVDNRDVVYYVRAIEEPSEAINASPITCEYDEHGHCIAASLCMPDEDCLTEIEERAWSSPIFVNKL